MVRVAAPTPAPVRAPAVEVSAAVQRLTIDEGSVGQRLDNFLIKVLKGAPKTLVYRIIRSGEVRVNKGRAAADTRLEMGDEVRVPPLRLKEKSDERDTAVPAREFPVLFEDDALLAINKPAGVAVHGGSGVSFGVIEQLRRARPQARFLELVHRLDKETSGILLVAKKRSALTTLQDVFRNRQVQKTYAALVIGDWPAARKVIDVSLHKFLTPEGERRVMAVKGEDEGRRSISLVHVVQRYTQFSLLDVTIKTGRTHQIRVHLQHEGHPIVGDDKYGDFALNKALGRGSVNEPISGVDRRQLPEGRFARMFLHARYLRLSHPVTGEPLTLEAPLPQDCAQLLAALTPLDLSSAKA
jgi:23S rRNA pseudouridine955/2504/2580 synthase